jgi:hypothetical protein
VQRDLAVNREIAVLPWGKRRADILAMNFKGTRVVIVEIKSSVADLRGDKKWHEYLPHSTQMYFAFTRDTWDKIKKKDLVPADKSVGILVLDPFPNYWHYSVKVARKAKIRELDQQAIHGLALRLAYRGAKYRNKDDVRRGGNNR